MARSMTGFGRAKAAGAGVEIQAEIRSVNHRHLQVRQRLPEEFSDLEPEIEEWMRKRLHRGAVNLTVSVSRSAPKRRVQLNLDLAKQYHAHLQKISRALKLGEKPELEEIVSLPGVFESVEASPAGAPKEQALLRKAIDQAVCRLEEARLREGSALEKDLRSRLKRLETLCERIQKGAPELVENYRERLRRRVDELLQGSAAKLREEDLAREVAIFAARSDIAEEITRLRTHLTEFARILKGEGEIGRQLDFLLQEMNRETNTIGSKSADAGIAHAVVEIKQETERIREQVQNLE